MHKVRKNLLPLFLALPLSAFAQQSDRIHKALKTYADTYPMEKVYLHTDKPYYAVGDTLRLSAYLIDATHHQPDSASGVLYIDLIDQAQKKVITHKVLKITNGLSSGSIALSDSLYGTGLYDLRAYTNWMLNFSEEFFFHQAVQVYETTQRPEKVQEPELESFSKVTDVQFFPEGGYLVDGIQNSVGLKGVNQSGAGVNFSGYIISNKNDTITFIKSKHLGLGNFTFVPERDKTYFLRVIEPTNSRVQEFKLPITKKEGFSMIVNNLGKSSIKVYATRNFTSAERPILVAHQRGNVVFIGQSGSDKQSVVFTIPKEAIPHDGIVHITLFNSAGVPQCERIVYNHKGESLTATVKADKDVYQPREKVKLDITVKDDLEDPVIGNFSLTVTDANQVRRHQFSENIETYFLLSSDVQNLNISGEIKGVIEQPGYYFDKKNPNALIHLDLLLLTQGWRRFVWTDVLKDSLTLPKHQFESGITLRGQALLTSGKPLKSVTDLIFMMQGGFLMETTDANGRFQVSNLDFNDSTAVLVQGLKEKGTKKHVGVLFDKPIIPSPAIFMDDESNKTFMGDEISAWLKRKHENDSLFASFKLNKVQVLKEAEVVAKRFEQDNRRMLYGSSNFKTLKVDNKTCGYALNILQLIQGKFAVVQVTGTGLDMVVTIRGEEPTLIIDGMPMDIEFLKSLVPCDVEAIDVINGPTVLFRASGGVISILTKRGSNSYDWSQEQTFGITINKIRGFDVEKEFYSPKYDNNEKPKIPDTRSTLYWNPSITTDSEGKAYVEFWNSDEKTNVNVILEGMSIHGKPATTRTDYTVK